MHFVDADDSQYELSRFDSSELEMASVFAIPPIVWRHLINIYVQIIRAKQEKRLPIYNN